MCEFELKHLNGVELTHRLPGAEVAVESPAGRYSPGTLAEVAEGSTHPDPAVVLNDTFKTYADIDALSSNLEGGSMAAVEDTLLTADRNNLCST